MSGVGEDPLTFTGADLERRYGLRHEFRVYQRCPVPKNIAPYIAVCCQDARAGAHSDAPVASIYRGDDARGLLNKYGKHSQYQLYHATPAQRREWGILGTPDAPGHSTHEQFSDGRAYPGVADGHPLAWWQLGFDVPDVWTDRVIHAAKLHGWELFRPYGAGVELHHLNFWAQPRPHSVKMAVRIITIRARMPRN